MPSQPETAEDTAERLAPTALALVRRLRSEPVDQLRHELLTGLSGRDRDALIMLLAAAVDPNVSPDIWWNWVRYYDEIETDRLRRRRELDGDTDSQDEADAGGAVDRLLAEGRDPLAVAVEADVSLSTVRRHQRALEQANGQAVAA